MTFLHSRKIRQLSLAFILPLLGIVSIAGIGMIALYSMEVGARYDIRRIENAIQQETVHNAELKDELYSLLDRKNAAEYAASQGLVLEKNPEYLQVETPIAPSLAQNL
ncbi:MAG: hypothetical protein AAB407_00120 [Patescibacteria group bacterium]